MSTSTMITFVYCNVASRPREARRGVALRLTVTASSCADRSARDT